MHNKNIGTGENGNGQVLLAILQNILFLDKIFQYFFTFNIKNYTLTFCFLIGIAVLQDWKMILVKLLIHLMAFNIPTESRWWYTMQSEKAA